MRSTFPPPIELLALTLDLKSGSSVRPIANLQMWDTSSRYTELFRFVNSRYSRMDDNGN